jgi:hypothetical protein
VTETQHKDKFADKHISTKHSITIPLYVPLPKIPSSHSLRHLRRKRNNLIQQRLTLSRRILRNLIPQMIHLRTRRSRRFALRRLNPANLHLQEELGHLNRQTPTCAPYPGLGRQIHIETILELRKVGGSEGRCGCEFLEGESQRGIF